MMLWGQFGVVALLIVVAGYKLIHYGDILAKKFKLGHAFVGAVLIGWCTSLPELVLSIGTARFAGAPDIAMGNVFGSNLFNLLIILLLDLYYWRAPILRQVGKQVNMSAWLSLIMVALATTLLAMSQKLNGLEVSAISMGYDSIAIFGFYAVCMLVLYFFENAAEPQNLAEEEKLKDVSLPATIIKCLFVMVVIVAVGLWLSKLSKEIATTYHLEEGFVGSFFLAVISSLPEVITCFVAVRMGFHAMALGTLFGSNIFNMTILSVCDIFYSGNLFSSVSKGAQVSNAFSGSMVLIMTFAILFALRSYKKTEKKGTFIGFESVVIAILYSGALYLSYSPDILLGWLGMK